MALLISCVLENEWELFEESLGLASSAIWKGKIKMRSRKEEKRSRRKVKRRERGRGNETKRKS